jgi:gluconolactonase
VRLSLALLALSALLAEPSSSLAPLRATTPQLPAVVRLDHALDALIAPDAQVEKVAGNFVFTEGPMWREGRLWFSDEEGGRVLAVTPTGEVTTLVDYTRPPLAAPDGQKTGPNAMATAPDGSVVMAQQYGRRVVRLTEAGGQVTPQPYFDSYDGHRLNSPNDLVFARDGSFYFTDPPYGLKGMDRSSDKQLPFNAVFHAGRGKLTPVITDLTLPNGIALSPDEKTLYVANSGPIMRVMRYDVMPDGTVAHPTVLAAFKADEGSGVPDGMKIDADGNIWTTAPGSIRILQPNGKPLGQIRVPEVAANLAWGDDGRTLYITARTSIYRIRTRVRGRLPDFAR